MQIGVGLPTTVPGASGELILDWARRADGGPFTSLGVLDRILYGSYDPLVTLAAAAAVTARVRLATTILISPLRNTVLLGKMAASIDALSKGRLTLGVALGARQDDYAAAEVDYRSRGARLGLQLATLREQWEDEGGIGPRPARAGGPELLIGGAGDAAFARMARYTDGYVHGGGPPRAFARAADKARAAWLDAGRPGRPRLWAQGYFALGDESTLLAGRAYLADYYAFTGHVAERIVEGLLTNPQAVAQFARGYADAGCDELILFPAVAELEQLERLTEILEQGLGIAGGMAERL
jgi:alkanesulfonate monooxygenase SsuD/methylene tetrahydromethanopterin reductase-like flavin-dependent oxidoreductase (luciferase family)